MNFIFDFGAKYIDGEDNSVFYDLLINFSGSFFGFGLSLMLFLWQIRKDKNKEIEKIKNDNLNHLKYFQLVLNSIIQFQKKEYILVEEYINNQKSDLLTLKSLLRYTDKDFIRIHFNDSKTLFESLELTKDINPNWVDDYKSLIGAIDYIESYHHEIFRIHEYNTKKEFKELQLICEMIENLPDVLFKISISIEDKIDSVSKNLHVIIDQHLTNYNNLIEQNTSSIQNLIDSFVRPLRDDFYKNFRNMSFSGEIIMLCKKILVKTKGVEDNVNDTINTLSKFESDTKNSFEILEKNNDNLSKFLNLK